MKFHPIFNKPFQKWWLLMAIISGLNFYTFGFPTIYPNKDYGYFFYTFSALFCGLIFGSILYLIYSIFFRKWNNKTYFTNHFYLVIILTIRK